MSKDIMKPKEKAEELVQEMFKPNNHYLNHNIEIDRDIEIDLVSFYISPFLL